MEVVTKKFYFTIIAIILSFLGVIVHGAYTDQLTGVHAIAFFGCFISLAALYISWQVDLELEEDSKKCSKKDQEYIENILKIR